MAQSQGVNSHLNLLEIPANLSHHTESCRDHADPSTQVLDGWVACWAQEARLGESRGDAVGRGWGCPAG